MRNVAGAIRHAELAAAVDQASDGIVVTDAMGLVRYVNPAFTALTGYSSEEVIGKNLRILKSGQHSGAFFKDLWDTIRSGRAWHGEMINQRKDGTTYCEEMRITPVSNPDGTIEGYIAIKNIVPPERQHQQAQAFLAALVDSSADAIISATVDGVILTWNRGAEALFGFTAEQAIGRPVSIYVPPERIAGVRRDIGQVSRGEVLRDHDDVMQRADGQRIHVMLTGSPVRDADGSVIAVTAVFRDISGRRESERKLRESEERFRQVFEHAPVGMYVAGLNEEIIQVNEAFCRMVGFSESDLLSKQWVDLCHPDDRAPALSRKGRLWKQDVKTADGERRYIRRNGSLVWCKVRISFLRDENGNPAYSVIHAEDITETRRALEALKESEARFRNMADACPSMMWVTDASGNFEFINKAYSAFTGQSCEEAQGANWTSHIHPDDLARTTAAHVRAINRRTTFSEEYQLRRADGEWRFIGSRGEPRFSPAGEYLGHSGLNADITEREQAKQLREFQHSLLRTIHEAALDGILVVDDKGKIISHSSKFLEVWRIPAVTIETQSQAIDSTSDGPDQPLMSALKDCVKDPEGFLIRFQTLYADHEASGQSEIELKDGRILERYSASLRNSRGQYIGRVWFFRDITERKRVDLALRESQEFVQSTLDALSSNISVLDENGTVIAVNQRWKDFGQANRSSLSAKPGPSSPGCRCIGIGANYLTVCDRAEGAEADNATRFADGIRRVLRGDIERYSQEYPCDSPQEKRWFSGSVTRFFFNGQPRMVVEHIDITKRRMAMLELQSSERKFRQFAENVNEIFWMTNVTGTEILYISPAYESIWGRSCASLHETPLDWMEAIHPEDRERTHGLFIRQLQGENIESEYRIITPDGSEKWIRNRAFPIRDQDGKVIRVAGISEDFTERKHYAEEMVRALEGAGAANRAKSRFLANMSHEIRTPMNGVIGINQLLLQTELTPEQRRYVEVSQGSGRALLKLLDAILDLSKIEAGKMVLENRTFELARVVEDVVQLMKVQGNTQNLMVESHISPMCPRWLSGDAHRLRQVLTNLCANAIKFTRQGRITVNVESESMSDRTAMIRISVADTGIGIRADLLSALFSPFVQADSTTTRKFGGTGLGLAISKQLVELMGGNIGVHSIEGSGSTFWFTASFERAVPDQPISPSSWPRDLSAPSNVALSGFKILIAEDNAINREVILAQLKKMGYQADAVTNGAEAVTAVQDKAYDLVLMDCEMPVMDGYEATARIHAIHAKLPIIALTANAMASDRERCLRKGMNDFLAKPVELSQLADALVKWMPHEESNATAGSTDGDVARGPGPVPVFDEKSLLLRLMGDRELICDVLDNFFKDAPTQLRVLRARIDKLDVSGVRLQAHTLKGSAATVGAEALRAVSQSVETAASAGQLDLCKSLLPDVANQLKLLMTTLVNAGWVSSGNITTESQEKCNV